MSASPTPPQAKPHLVIVGSGGRPYREYSFATLTAQYRLSGVFGAEPTWQSEYLDGHVVTDLSDPLAIVDAVRSLAGEGAEVGMLTWDETAVEAAAVAAEKLGLPHIPAAAVAHCRDKYAARSLTAAAGLPSVGHRLVVSADQAVLAAEEFGYPVVVKPRALAGSIGVVRADGPEQVRAAFDLADESRFADLPTGHGVLVEEYLDGEELSVDSVVFDSEVRCVHIARKRLGFSPYFEEVGHLVADLGDEPWQQEVRTLVEDAHHALGVRTGVTHAEVRLTSRGPRLVELNARLGGDLIPYVSSLATGIDLVRVAAELAFGRRPELTADRRTVAEIRFVYPPYDGTVRSLDLAAAAAVPGIVHVGALVEPGTRLLLPPKQAIPRLAALVAVGTDEQECRTALDRAERAVTAEITPDTPAVSG